MKVEQIKEKISNLDLSEKLLLVEDIWDSIAADNLEIPMAAWQKEELNQRYKDYKEGRLKLHSWDKVHKDLRKKYQ
ncbi:MAG: addiction module protein [Spirochaetota bacterium]